MSVATRNPFAALADDGDDDAPTVAPVAKPAPAAATASTKPAPAAGVAKPTERKPRGDYAGRGAPRKVYQGDREPLNADSAGSGGAAGLETRGERGTRGAPRGGKRGGRGRGGGSTGAYLGGDRPRRENGGGRPFDKHSQTGHTDSAKAKAQGWGADDGQKELIAEIEGEKDAQNEAKPPADDSAAPAPAAAEAEEKPAAPVEKVDNTKTYDEYLAEQTEKKLQFNLPQARVANEGADETQWKTATQLIRKAAEDETYFSGKEKTSRVRKQKEGKTFIEIEPTFRPPQRDAPRGGRGRGEGFRAARGERRGRGRGAEAGRGRGGRPSQAAQVDIGDNTAFPSLS